MVEAGDKAWLRCHALAKMLKLEFECYECDEKGSAPRHAKSSRGAQ